MTTGSWGYYQQGQEQQEQIELLGNALNLHMHCPIHYPAWGKRLFECKCGVLFPLFVVQAAVDSGDWSAVDKKHRKEVQYVS